MPLPIVLGHQGVGRIWRPGAGVPSDFSGNPLRERDTTQWSSNFPCGRCHWGVVAEERTLCEARKVCGVNQQFDDLSGLWEHGEAIYLQPGSAIFRVLTSCRPST